MKRKNITRIVRLLIGIVIIIVLVYKVGLMKTINALGNANLLIFLVAYVFLFISYIFDTVNLKLFYDTLSRKMSFSDLFSYYLYARIGSLFLPGRLGDFTMVYFTKRDKISYGESVAVLLFDKVITFFVFSVLGAFGVLLLLKRNIFWYVALLFLAVLVVLIALFSPAVRNFVKKRFQKAKLFKGFNSTFMTILQKHHFAVFLNLVNTIVRIIVFSITVYFVYLSLGVTVPLLSIVLIEAIISLLIMIPITINGMGIKETSGV